MDGGHGEKRPMGATAMNATVDDVALALLREWFAWWVTCNRAPAVMPESLHLRTELVLVKAALRALQHETNLPVCDLCFQEAPTGRGVCVRCSRVFTDVCPEFPTTERKQHA